MSTSISPSVYRYLADRPGRTCYRLDMARELDLGEKRVRDAVQRLRRKGVPIEKVGTGASAWRFIPEEEQTHSENGHARYERLAVTKTGAWVLQDAEGNVTIVREEAV